MPTNWNDYDDFVNDAARDDRVGPQEFLISSVTDGVWEKSGEPFRELTGVLTSANNASFDFRISPVPPPDVLAAQKATMDSAKKKAIASSITMHKTLAQHYGKAYDEIKSGDRFKVEIVKNKQGFVRAVAFLAKDHVVGNQSNGSQAADSGVPF